MQPSVTLKNVGDHMATSYRQVEAAGKVALVLGAGNVAAIGPTDLAQKLFVEGQVCMFKHNPVNEYLAPFLEAAFGELIRDGFVRTSMGSVDVGEYLCQHPDVDEIHLTGSDRTYEAIVFGAGPEGAERKRNNQPRLAKRVTSELGNVTPVIVVPGPWNDADIAFHAENVATQIANNCGFNCLSARVLVMHESWPQSEALMKALRALLASTPQRTAYYPRAETRYDEVLAANPSAQPVGQRGDGVIPYTLIPRLDPADRGNPCFLTECFVPVLAQASLPGADAAEFLRNAVQFCNETLWGTLCANILVHPKTARVLGSRLEDAIAELRYGTVAVNQWAAMGYVWGSRVGEGSQVANRLTSRAASGRFITPSCLTDPRRVLSTVRSACGPSPRGSSPIAVWAPSSPAPRNWKGPPVCRRPCASDSSRSAGKFVSQSA
jgi:acyl-CoA reductase-like NAD-dependent aldehyde dehydrogenase